VRREINTSHPVKMRLYTAIIVIVCILTAVWFYTLKSIRSESDKTSAILVSMSFSTLVGISDGLASGGSKDRTALIAQLRSQQALARVLWLLESGEFSKKSHAYTCLMSARQDAIEILGSYQTPLLATGTLTPDPVLPPDLDLGKFLLSRLPTGTLVTRDQANAKGLQLQFNPEL
jgi:hypothetical protein